MAVNHASDFRPQARSEIAMRNETALLNQRECFAHFCKDIYWSTSAYKPHWLHGTPFAAD